MSREINASVHIFWIKIKRFLRFLFFIFWDLKKIAKSSHRIRKGPHKYTNTDACVGAHTCLLVNDDLQHVTRLVNQDDSLADLTMLSASSVEATLPREEQELLERQEEREQQEEQEKEQALVVVIPDTDATGNKARSFSDQRQSSTDESRYCSGGTEPEPSTEQSSGSESATMNQMLGR